MFNRIAPLHRNFSNLLLVALLSTSSVAFSSVSPNQEPRGPRAANFTDRIIVKMRAGKAPSLSAADGSQLASTMSAATGRTFTYSHEALSRVAVLKADAAMSIADARRMARQMAQQPDVEYAEPDVRMFKAVVPNDTSFATQWALQPLTATNYGINAAAAWDVTTGNASLVVAVLDTGITTHTDLAGRTVAGYDFVSDTDISNDGTGRDSDPSDPGDWLTQAEINANPTAFEGCPVSDSSWHGTHAAGIIGAATNNGAGIAGVNWLSKIQPVRVLGKCYGLTSDIAAAIVWAAGGTVSGVANNPTPAKVINLSLGGTSPCENTYRDAVAQAVSLGAVVVVAAGNETAGTAGSAPANCAGAIAVSALDIDGFRAGYSNYGSPTTISAPGGDASAILSTLNAGTTVPAAQSYGGLVGTSFAAPHVAGVASLMLSIRPTLQPHHVIALMRGTASAYRSLSAANSFYDCSQHPCGDGLLNAAAAVAAAQACTTPPSGTPAAISVTCNGDYDGNGVVSALTDGVIATRLALGMNGTALTSGGVLGACATRTTYAAIRAYSNRNCGTNYAP